ncbi:hypothetical protein OBBRIDRAFT_793065 [Obba rivulosa]|uniref:Uncharacterized protein n=1 Tax=Obba rivulosa TaxID=1052685 RepID=A0A8E2AYN9_9APHY|nr:hypothetical protein OBBRIDRAFT_793065 [Obba rivulosa]
MPEYTRILPWFDTAASFLDLGTAGVKFGWAAWRYRQSTHETPDPLQRLDKLRKLLDECDEFLESVKTKDPLMGQVVEHNDPGWTNKFRGQVRNLRGRYTICKYELDAMTRAKDKTSKEAFKRESLRILEVIEELTESARDMTSDHLTTSTAAYESSVYLSLKDTYTQDADQLDTRMIALKVKNTAREQAYERAHSDVITSSAGELSESSLRKRRSTPSASEGIGIPDFGIPDFDVPDFGIPDFGIPGRQIPLVALHSSRSDRPYD